MSVATKPIGRPRSKSGRREVSRVNLLYRGDEVDRLLYKLQRDGQHGTITETVLRALRAYEVLLDERTKGNTVTIHDKNGSVILRLI